MMAVEQYQRKILMIYLRNFSSFLLPRRLEIIIIHFFFKKIFYIEGGEGREKERERNINMWLPFTWPPTGDLAHNPGMCPDWELNL